ncbi:hypothetical protein E2C01_071793 [Portunus trituberculatus]|uniref:Uncharacterized protein n=1 Tax=Portunus trituberculatus TaxID=210409 RepID=A0A5B7HW70_PORTR|nr:hypothetical protein [Portunus trituberculatus]
MLSCIYWGNIKKNKQKDIRAQERHAPPQDLKFSGSTCQGQGTHASLERSEDPTHRTGEETEKNGRSGVHHHRGVSYASPAQPQSLPSTQMGGLLTGMAQFSAAVSAPTFQRRRFSARLFSARVFQRQTVQRRAIKEEEKQGVNSSPIHPMTP